MNMTSSNIKAMIQCDSYKVWETVLAVEHYHTWRSDVSKTELIDEKQFIEYSPNGYSTTFTAVSYTHLLSTCNFSSNAILRFFYINQYA